MQRRRFQNEVATGKLTLPVTIMLSTILWIVVFFLKPMPKVGNPYLFWQELMKWIPSGNIDNILSFLFYGMTGYLLIECNNAYSIIRVRTSLQASIYFLMILAFTFLHNLNVGCILSPCLGVSLYFLFRSYQRQQPVGYIFHSMLPIGLGSLFFPPFLFLTPIFYLGAYTFKSLTIRTFFAGIVGLCVPYWFLLGHAFFYNQMELFYTPFQELVTFIPIDYSQLSIASILSMGITVLLLIVSSIHYFVTSYQDKIRTRFYLNFLIFIAISIVIFWLLQPQHADVLLQLLLPVTALLTGHLFTLTNTKVSNLFFIFSILLLITITCYNLWML